MIWAPVIPPLVRVWFLNEEMAIMLTIKIKEAAIKPTSTPFLLISVVWEGCIYIGFVEEGSSNAFRNHFVVVIFK